MLLLVEDRRGYQNLCQLITAAKAGKHKSDPVDAPTDLLAAHAGGLIALAGAAPRADLPALVDMFGRGRVYLEVQRHLDADEAHRNRDVLAQADGARRRRGRHQRRPLRHARAARSCTTC